MGGMLIFLPGFYINLILWFCLHNETLQITKKQARIFSFVKLDICISRTIWIKDLKCYYLVVWLGHRQYIHRLWYLLRLHRIIDFFFLSFNEQSYFFRDVKCCFSGSGYKVSTLKNRISKHISFQWFLNAQIYTPISLTNLSLLTPETSQHLFLKVQSPTM